MTPKVSYPGVTSLIPRHLLQGAEGHVLAASASWKRRRCTTFRRPVSTCDRCARQPVVPQTTSAELYESGECARTNNRAHSAVGWSPIVAMLAGGYRANGTVPPRSAGRRRAGMLGECLPSPQWSALARFRALVRVAASWAPRGSAAGRAGDVFSQLPLAPFGTPWSVMSPAHRLGVPSSTSLVPGEGSSPGCGSSSTSVTGRRGVGWTGRP
jgi:hypothetical protein